MVKNLLNSKRAPKTMKVISALVLLIAAVAAFPVEEEGSPLGWYVPQEDGSFEWMSEADLQAMTNDFVMQGRAAAEVHYYLYTRSNSKAPQTLISGDVNSLKKSHFSHAHPTRFVIHGWQSTADTELCYDIRDALLAVGDYNVICVDWSDKAQTINYAASKLRVPGVGKQVAGMIDFLHKDGGLSFETLLVAGHSLGAHVSGFAGKNVKYGRIHQITGLDPALPLYSYDKPSERLNQNDATYVESIQTNGGMLGFLKPIGKGAFYPNGGKSQPGCGVDLTGACAHSRSYEYYAEAIRKNDFPTMKCGDYEEAVDKKCGSTYSSVRMGASTNFINANGDFYVPVNKRAPFGKAA